MAALANRDQVLVNLFLAAASIVTSWVILWKMRTPFYDAMRKAVIVCGLLLYLGTMIYIAAAVIGEQ
jgi:hypothetical protein